MTDKSDLTDAEWHALTDAPLLVTMTMVAAGQHGPISMMKESSASAHAIIAPGDRGAANSLIQQLLPEAQSKQARHDAKEHKGATIAAVVAGCLGDLEEAAAVTRKLPADEAHGLGSWLFDIASAVAAASKGVSDTERDALDKIAALFGVDSLPS
jgi:hypothetical protein